MGDLRTAARILKDSTDPHWHWPDIVCIGFEPDVLEAIATIRKAAKRETGDLVTTACQALASMEAVTPLLRTIQEHAPPGDHDEIIARYVVNRDALADALKENSDG